MIRKGGTNAKKELKECLTQNNIICARIDYGDERFGDVDEDAPLKIILKEGYTPEEEEIFWNTMDFNYDSGYGGQELFGMVWLENDVWLTRGEYDGSEWWEGHVLPEIPPELKSLKRILKKI